MSEGSIRRETGDVPSGPEPAPRADASSGSIVFLESALWKRLNEASSRAEVAEAWLALQCRMVDGAVAGLLILRNEEKDDRLEPASVWPENGGIDPVLSRAAHFAANERRGAVKAPRGSGGTGSIAYPIIVDNELHGAVAISVKAEQEDDLRAAIRQLQWGLAWVRDRIRRRQGQESGQVLGHARLALDLLATVLEQERFKAACMAAVTEIAIRSQCDRVSVGFVRRGAVRVAAISHSAQFGKQMNLVRGVAEAMDEAVDQKTLILCPSPNPEEPVATNAHQRLAENQHIGHLLTIPLLVRDAFIGALTLERPPERPFSQEDVELLDAVATAIGPVLDEKWQNDRFVVVKAGEAGWRQLKHLFGPDHVARKLVLAGLIAAVAFFYFATGDYRVTANAELEGVIRRAVVAPYDGFIKEAHARPGDQVEAGEVLASLDDRDLALERLKWVTDRQQRMLEYDRALASRERAQINVARTQIDQAEAQIELIDTQMARATLTAPFDGIVVSGDLSQSIGAAVQRADVLFEIAPLDDYRVNLDVDERQVSDISVGQRGFMLASAMPEDPFPFTVTKVTPVAVQKDGRNVFRVEAKVDETSPRLRPGMEGVAKIEVDDRRLIWIWTRSFVEWFRLWLWRWVP